VPPPPQLQQHPPSAQVPPPPAPPRQQQQQGPQQQGPQQPGAAAGPPAAPMVARMEHPLLAPMYWACADLLAFAPQLALGDNLPAPDALRGTARGMFGEMARRAQEANIPPEDVRDAQYAIAALFDEQILRARWSGSAEWNAQPLQFLYFQENKAGEGFFRKLDALRNEPHRAHVMQIYFLCLAMGFQGSLGLMGGDGLASTFERTAAALDRFIPASDPTSPHGEPPDLGRNMLSGDRPLIRIGIGILALALVVFIVLEVVIHVSASSAAGPMKSYAGSTK